MARPCDTQPCKNSGTCFNKIGGKYFCACRNNFKGDRCQEQLTTLSFFDGTTSDSATTIRSLLVPSRTTPVLTALLTTSHSSAVSSNSTPLIMQVKTVDGGPVLHPHWLVIATAVAVLALFLLASVAATYMLWKRLHARRRRKKPDYLYTSLGHREERGTSTSDSLYDISGSPIYETVPTFPTWGVRDGGYIHPVDPGNTKAIPMRTLDSYSNGVNGTAVGNCSRFHEASA